MIETERQSNFLQKSLWRRGDWPEQRNDPALNLLLVGELLLRFRHQTFSLKSEGSINLTYSSVAIGSENLPKAARPS